MKVKLKTKRWAIEFEGSSQVWNQTLRKTLGGVAAAAEPDDAGEEPTARGRGAEPETRSPRRAPSPPTSPLTTAIDGPSPPRRLSFDRAEAARPPAREPTRTAIRSTRRTTTAGGPLPPPPDDLEPLFDRLGAQSGRRAEKDTVLASVWCLGGGEEPVDSDAVDEFVETHSDLEDVKVRPHLLKHVSKTKLLQEEDDGAFRLTPKGRRYVRENFA